MKNPSPHTARSSLGVTGYFLKGNPMNDYLHVTASIGICAGIHAWASSDGITLNLYPGGPDAAASKNLMVMLSDDAARKLVTLVSAELARRSA